MSFCPSWVSCSCGVVALGWTLCWQGQCPQYWLFTPVPLCDLIRPQDHNPEPLQSHRLPDNLTRWGSPECVNNFLSGGLKGEWWPRLGFWRKEKCGCLWIVQFETEHNGTEAHYCPSTWALYCPVLLGSINTLILFCMVLLQLCHIWSVILITFSH